MQSKRTNNCFHIGIHALEIDDGFLSDCMHVIEETKTNDRTMSYK